MPAVCLSEARLEASDVCALVCEAHPCGGGPVGGGQVGLLKGSPALPGASGLQGGGGVPGRGVRRVGKVFLSVGRGRC